MESFRFQEIFSKGKQSHINHVKFVLSFLLPKNSSSRFPRQKKRKFITQTSQVDVIEYIFTVSWNFKKFIFLINIRGMLGEENSCCPKGDYEKWEMRFPTPPVFHLGTSLMQKTERMMLIKERWYSVFFLNEGPTY